jgi:hypothetical protein
MKKALRHRKRKCKFCDELYLPDYRNRWHQRFCSKEPCSQASKTRSQQKWLLSEKGQGYFEGPDNVNRVREWRRAHPKYSKRSATSKQKTLQDDCSSQLIVQQGDKQGLNIRALQDVCSVQPALLIGLIASLTGSTLQDEIAETSRRFIISGRDILGIGPEYKPTGGRRDGRKTHSLSGSPSSRSEAVQLGGPLPGAG